MAFRVQNALPGFGRDSETFPRRRLVVELDWAWNGHRVHLWLQRCIIIGQRHHNLPHQRLADIATLLFEVLTQLHDACLDEMIGNGYGGEMQCTIMWR